MSRKTLGRTLLFIVRLLILQCESDSIFVWRRGRVFDELVADMR